MMLVRKSLVREQIHPFVCMSSENARYTRMSSEKAHISKEIVIDGSQGEGGGQILRNAITFANILRKPFSIYNIRSGKGLKAQHLAALRLPTEICGGKLHNDYIQSLEIRYDPLNPESTKEKYNGDIGTAGSICLLLQSALPCALYHSRPIHMVVTGGTNATFAPQFDYWERVFCPILREKCELHVDQIQANVIRRGYFPRGGGEVHVMTKPLSKPLHPILMTERGTVSEIRIRSFHAGKLGYHLALEMANAAQSYLQDKYGADISIIAEIVTEKDAVGNGLGIIIVASTSRGCRLAGSALCDASNSAHNTGILAASELYATLEDGGCVDEWLQDQLILYMALADGRSEVLSGSLTLHTKSAIEIAETFTGVKFSVERVGDVKDTGASIPEVYGKAGRASGQHLISCRGIGFFPS